VLRWLLRSLWLLSEVKPRHSSSAVADTRIRGRPPTESESTVIPLSIQTCAAHGQKRTHMHELGPRVVPHATHLQQAPPQLCRPRTRSRPASRCRKPCRSPCRCLLSQPIDRMEHARTNFMAPLAIWARGEHWPCSPALWPLYHSNSDQSWSPDLGGVQPVRGSWYWPGSLQCVATTPYHLLGCPQAPTGILIASKLTLDKHEAQAPPPPPSVGQSGPLQSPEPSSPRPLGLQLCHHRASSHHMLLHELHGLLKETSAHAGHDHELVHAATCSRAVAPISWSFFFVEHLSRPWNSR